jgi:CBS domain-containing protein
MEDMYVARLMTTDLITATPKTTVEEATNLLLENATGSLPAVDPDNEIVGILTRTDFVSIVAHTDRRPRRSSSAT